MAKPSDLTGGVLVVLSVAGLVLLNYGGSIVPPVYSAALSSIFGTVIVSGAILIGRKRMKSLDDKKEINVKAWLNSRLLLIINSAITLVRPNKQVSDAKATLTNLVSGSMGIGGWFLLTRIEPSSLHQGTFYLIPDTLLVCGLIVLSLTSARISKYAMKSSLTILGRQMAAEFKQTVTSKEFKDTAIIFGFKIGMLIPLFPGSTLLYFIAADYALKTGNTYLYWLLSGSSFLMAWLTRKRDSGLQVTKSFKFSTSMFFLTGGIATLLNLGIPAFINVPYATASIYQHYSFDFILGGGMFGELSYLAGFYAIGSSYVEARVRRTVDVNPTYTDTTLDRWMIILTSILHFLQSLRNDLLVLYFAAFSLQ